jgi:hypothetical protein
MKKYLNAFAYIYSVTFIRVALNYLASILLACEYSSQELKSFGLQCYMAYSSFEA